MLVTGAESQTIPDANKSEWRGVLNLLATVQKLLSGHQF
jgi:hypothetical protein